MKDRVRLTSEAHAAPAPDRLLTHHLRQLGECRPFKRTEVLDRALHAITWNVPTYFSVLDLLEAEPSLRAQADRYGIYDKLTDPVVVRRLFGSISRASGIVDWQAEFTSLFDRLGTEKELLAQAVLYGCLDQPVNIFSVSETRERLVKGTQHALKVSHAFARALMLYPDKTKSDAAFGLWTNTLVAPHAVIYNIFDLLTFWSIYGAPEEAELAASVIEAIGTMEYIRFGIPDIDGDKVAGLQERFGKLASIWGGEITDHPKVTLRNKNGLKQAVDSFIPLKHGSSLAAFHPQPDHEIGTWGLIEYMRFLGAELAKHNCGWHLVRYPEGVMTFVFYNRGLTGKAQLEQITYELLGGYFTQANATVGIGRQLNPEGADCVLSQLRPELDDRRLAATLPEVKKDATGGIHAVGRRGQKVIFNSPAEESLRRLGYRGILFKQVAEGIKVEVDWGDSRIGFYLDRTYEPRGLENLTAANRDWLMALTYSYLAAVKRPVEAQVRYHENQGGLASAAGLELFREDATDRSPHLRVLPVTYKSHQLSEIQIAEETHFHFGATLDDINAAFLAAQDNLETLASLDPILGNLTQELIKRVLVREEQPEWVRIDRPDVGPMQMMILRNPPVGYDPNTFVYMVSFVRETEVVGVQEPMLVSCPEAFDRLKQLL